MAANSNYALRVPSSLMTDVRMAAEGDGVSMNSFIVQAVAEKVAILRARGLLRELSPDEQAAYFEERLRSAGRDRLEEVLRKAGTTEAVLPGDELPDDWLPEVEADVARGLGR